MSITVTCGECFATLKFPEDAVGKRDRCKQCQAAVLVEQEQATDELDDDVGDKPARAKKQGRKSAGSTGARNAFQKFLIFAAGNPWVGMGLFGLLVWGPVSLIFPQEILTVDVIIALLAVIGCGWGILMSLMGVAIRNPYEAVSTLAIGALVSQVVPDFKVGVVTGKVSRVAGVKSLGDADTGAAGRMAIYSGVVIVVLLAHITALSFVIVGRMK